MTGRKDIPRIFLTYSPSASHTAKGLDVWESERKELCGRILAAPELRISHILHHVDRLADRLRMVAIAMAQFCKGARRLLSKTLVATVILAAAAAGFLDAGLQPLLGFPQETLLSALISRSVDLGHLLIPAIGMLAAVFLMGLLFTKWMLPGYAKRYRKHADRLITVDTPYSEHQWVSAKTVVIGLLEHVRFKAIFAPHRKHVAAIDRFIHRELQSYFEKIR